MAPEPPPLLDPVAWLLRESYLDARDTAGRPLGEANAPSGFGPADIVEETCTYPDRRAVFQAPMNVSALRQVAAAWPDIQRTMLAARSALSERRAPTLAEAWRAAMTLRALPIRTALGGHTPSELHAGCYKTGLGYAKIYWIAALIEGPTRLAHEVLPPDRFFGFLDEGDWLVGRSQVCAGTRRMIEQGHEKLVGGTLADLPAPALAPEDTRFAAAFARLEGLAGLAFALVRERARQNRVSEVPGFGNPATAPIHEWPGCVSLYQASTSIMVTTLRGIPGIGTDAVLATLRAAGLASPSLSVQETMNLYDLDAVLAAELATFSNELGPSPGDWAAACATLLHEPAS